MAACGDVKNLDVLDVGCGSGFFSRELARSGANVQAFDYSSSLVDLANEEEKLNPLGIQYCQLDAALVETTFEPSSFDVVTGCMSIADIEQLDTALAGIHKVLNPGSALNFSLPHPFASHPENRWRKDLADGAGGREFTRYFGRDRVRSGLNNIPGKPDGPEIKVWHMTVSGWQDLLNRIGFRVERFIEPYPTIAQLAEHPSLSRIANTPEFMVIVASRT